MLSYSNSLSLYQKLTNNSETANTTFFNLIFNEKLRTLLGDRPWSFLERTRTGTTTTLVQSYYLPADCKKLINVYITSGTQNYIPREVPNRKFWDNLNSTTTQYADDVQWFIIINNKIYFYPIPATSGLTITYVYITKQKDLSIADYTTGTITSIANAGVAVVGSSTVWTAKMAGRFIRFTDSDTANTGDGEWYEILSVGSGTTLTLLTPYNGTSIVAGTAAYSIGQVSLLPETYHSIPVYEAVADYWAKESNGNLSQFYQGKADKLKEQMENEYFGLSTDVIVEEEDDYIKNPNLYIKA